MFVRRSRYDALRREYHELLRQNTTMRDEAVKAAEREAGCKEYQGRLLKGNERLERENASLYARLAKAADFEEQHDKLLRENADFRYRLMRVREALDPMAEEVDARESVIDFEEGVNSETLGNY
jgi:predicted  nucleic acid-binding Zn-ribbon protein